VTITEPNSGRRGDAALQQHLAPSRLGQATAVEQSRAIAEVQAAIVVAQQIPRNVPQAIESMRDSCRRKELADRAFYRFPKGGQVVTGPSIHLARELARIWGNIQWGLNELRRDDDYGQSEMLAFAWDVQANSRCSTVIINPHRLYAGGGGKRLTELRDVYDNNTNVGSRRVREAIFAVLPTWFVEEAQDLCARTMAEGGGVPLPQRIANAIEVFGNLGITVPQLEAKLGTGSGRWTDQDVAQLRIIRQSLMRGEVRKEDEFPPARVTAADITSQPQAPAAEDDTRSGPAGQPASQAPGADQAVNATRDNPRAARDPAASARGAQPPPPQDHQPKPKGQPAPPAMVAKMDDLIARVLEPAPRKDIDDLIGWLCPGYSATRSEVKRVTDHLDGWLEAAHGDIEAASDGIWSQMRRALGEQQGGGGG